MGVQNNEDTQFDWSSLLLGLSMAILTAIEVSAVLLLFRVGVGVGG